MSEEARGKTAPEEFEGNVNCDWLNCMAGMGIAGSGICFLRGEWDNAECPQFRYEPVE